MQQGIPVQRPPAAGIIPHGPFRMSTTTFQRDQRDQRDHDTGTPWAAAAPEHVASPLGNACWALLDALVLAMVATLQALWGPSPLPCARAGVYVFNAMDAATCAGCWLSANERWYNSTGTQVLPKPRTRTGVVKWLGDRLDPWQ
jgi:hypothetical protein